MLRTGREIQKSEEAVTSLWLESVICLVIVIKPFFEQTVAWEVVNSCLLNGATADHFSNPPPSPHALGEVLMC